MAIVKRGLFPIPAFKKKIKTINMSKKFTRQYKALGMEVPEEGIDPYVKSQMIYQAACKKVGIHPGAIGEPSAELPNKYKISGQSHYQLMIIRDAIVDNREADWNSDERKYGGWFWMNKPGFRFSDSDFGIATSDTSSGSRLCTFSDEEQEFFMKECIALWADFYGGELPA